MPAVLVDLYSTLVHERPENPFYDAIAEALDVADEPWRACYRRLGPAMMKGEIASMAERVSLACLRSGQARDIARVEKVVTEKLPLFTGSVVLDPHATAMLASFRAAGYKVAIVSNASNYSEVVLDRLELRSKVDNVTMSYRVGWLKPHPAIYLAALSGLTVPACDATFIGDGGDDELAGARRLGLHTVLIDRGLAHTDGARRYADAVCMELNDAYTWVLTGQKIEHA